MYVSVLANPNVYTDIVKILLIDNRIIPSAEQN